MRSSLRGVKLPVTGMTCGIFTVTILHDLIQSV